MTVAGTSAAVAMVTFSEAAWVKSPVVSMATLA